MSYFSSHSQLCSSMCLLNKIPINYIEVCDRNMTECGCSKIMDPFARHCINIIINNDQIGTVGSLVEVGALQMIGYG